MNNHHLEAIKRVNCFEELGFSYGKDVRGMLEEKVENKWKCAVFREEGEEKGMEVMV